MLVDNHNRAINYLRLAVTDRCNLRCNYCMPEEGINFAKNDKLFTIDELVRLSEIVVAQGIDKIRITGGEPFVRKDLMVLLRSLSKLEGLNDISVTTNATLIGPHINELKELGIKNINVSMDAINRETFERITRRNEYDVVYNNIIRLITEGFNVRINFIALEGQNTEDIIPMLELTKHYDVSVRFLEEMPFNGGSKKFQTIKWDFKTILEHIRNTHSEYYKLESPKTSTSLNYKIPGFKGTFGVIPSFSRTFCGSCNRLRISATGDVITCLYAKASMNLRDIMRGDDVTENIKEQILKAVGSRAKTGFEAQEKYKDVFSNSMTSIGG
ncbi:GTP 3',8-cyclase MoaA [Maribacter stanieri]|uniref:GTP 3',8-cyclase n=1 Tax=Maribacter stanieri TaxID=440514 RepID=A0A1I6JQY4_9FLAO|nr:GTP 3',8-cyclase MoaA [Maribacter stanieri]SFR81331.1 cyclic pyranopterin monophosphate synthase subunit MoaA [Maribacter stanieri]|tara:strand:- start:56 stop:1039 length:984 start_codon:yes stop_codon:yes gene_type:complete